MNFNSTYALSITSKIVKIGRKSIMLFDVETEPYFDVRNFDALLTANTNFSSRS